MKHKAGNDSGFTRREFCFLHTYESSGRYWRGLEKAGLIRKHTGVRLINSPFGSDEHRFNVVAREGSDLHRVISARRCPMIVDRLSGGAPYLNYRYNDDLIGLYERMLGDRFYGFQLHEMINNTVSSWKGLLSLKVADRDRIVDVRDAATRSRISSWDFGHGVLTDYQGRTFPNSIEAMWREFELFTRLNASRANGFFSFCDGSQSGQFAFSWFYKKGSRAGIVQAGAFASQYTQFAIASLRGTAQAYGKPWGVFFAPWGSNGGTCMIAPAQNTWHAPKEWEHPSVVSPENGPSSALQRRLFFYTYLSGAHFMHEEWGAECNLLDWEAGTISSYGQVTKALLNFQDRHPDVGEPYAPIALVLNAGVVPPAELQHRRLRKWKVMDLYEPRDIDLRWASIIEGLYGRSDVEILSTSRWQTPEIETICLTESRYPEIFEIVPSDAPADVWKRYKKIYVFDGAEAPAGAIRVNVDKKSGDWRKQVFDALTDESPFEHSGALTVQINYRKRDGAWIVGLYNPHGARRGNVSTTGAILDDACAVTGTLHPKFSMKSARLLYGWPAATAIESASNHVRVNVGPGGLAILEILPVKGAK